MSLTENFELRVLRLAESIRSGEADPLEVKLTPEYKELQKMAADIGKRLDIDEMLNEILGVKVSRIQELAKVLAAPELYVNRLRRIETRELAGMIAYHRPLRVTHLDPEPLDRAFDRVSRFIDAMTAEPPLEQVPNIAQLPNGYTFQTEDAVLLEDAKCFGATIANGRPISLHEIIVGDNMEESLRRFLYVVILISSGFLVYDSSSQTVIRGDNSTKYRRIHHE
ncbi:MAG: hypothetical protein ACXADO_08670 [Candidatus Thorarchaeota archaeon]|jgi:hypothetical protein